MYGGQRQRLTVIRVVARRFKAQNRTASRKADDLSLPVAHCLGEFEPPRFNDKYALVLISVVEEDITRPHHPDLAASDEDGANTS